VSVAIFASVLYKSRPGRESSAPAAFSVSSSSHGFVRVSGDVRHAGMYPLPANKMTIAAINMADPVLSARVGLSESDASAPIFNGTALHVTARPNETLVVAKSQIAVNERLVMGIPLDINTMSEADFDKVPGIGPMLARRIVVYRQNNGGSMAVAELLLVKGIGDKKYFRLLKYF
jgi:competence protein ComEA